VAAERQKTVFLTGATSGIGLATAERLTQKGYAVWGTTRSLDRAAGWSAQEAHLHASDG